MEQPDEIPRPWAWVLAAWEQKSGQRLTRQRAQQIVEVALKKCRRLLEQDPDFQDWSRNDEERDGLRS